MLQVWKVTRWLGGCSLHRLVAHLAFREAYPNGQTRSRQLSAMEEPGSGWIKFSKSVWRVLSDGKPRYWKPVSLATTWPSCSTSKLSKYPHSRVHDAKMCAGLKSACDNGHMRFSFCGKKSPIIQQAIHERQIVNNQPHGLRCLLTSLALIVYQPLRWMSP